MQPRPKVVSSESVKRIAGVLGGTRMLRCGEEVFSIVAHWCVGGGWFRRSTRFLDDGIKCLCKRGNKLKSES